MSDDEGRLVGGRYRLGGVLGRGGMGTVWRAEDEILGRTVAVKELRFPSSVDDDEKQRLVTRTLREAKAIARIRSGSAVTVFDVVNEDDRPWIVMELVEGRSLADEVRQDGPLKPQRAAEVGLAILDVLRAAHREGILHRDVKPSNVLLEDVTGRVVLTDFGIAKVEGDPSVTSTGMLVGAPSYISPERARGKPPGPPADLWSLGGLLYAAVEGHPPYDKGSAISTLTAVMTEPVPEPANAGGLTEAIYGLLAKDPELRLDVDSAQALLKPVAAGEKQGEAAGATRTMTAPASGGAGKGASGAGDGASGGVAKTRASASSGPAAGSAPNGERRRGAWKSMRGAAAAGAAAKRTPGTAASGSGAAETAGPAEGAGTPQAERAAKSGAAQKSAAVGAGAGKGLPEEESAAAAGGLGSAAGPAAAKPAGGPAGSGSFAALKDRVSQRVLAVCAAVVAAVLVLVGAVVLSTGDGSESRRGGAQQESGTSSTEDKGKGGAAEDGEKSGDKSPGDEESAPSGAPEPPPEKDKDKAGEDALPEGYGTVADDKFHFRMALPEGWKRAGIAGQDSGRKYAGPDGGLPKIQVDFNPRPLDDASSAWRDLEPAVKGSSTDYRLISLEKADWRDYPTVADWQFVRKEDGEKVRVLNRGFKVDGSHGYAIMITCKAGEWKDKECKTLRETAFKTFKPLD